MANARIIRLTAGIPGLLEKVTFSKILPSGAAAPSKDEMEQMLQNVSLDKRLHLYAFNAAYSIAPNDRPDPASFSHNTVVEVALPYCLHLPNHFELEMPLPDRSGKARIIFRKVWTKASEGSAATDVYADDRLTFLAPTSLQTPTFPEDAILGHEPAYTGVNLERDREVAGYFRYSRLQLNFNTDYGDLTALIGDAPRRAQQDCVAIALALVNRIIDVYRFVTREDYVQRLGSVHVPNLYFPIPNFGLYGASLGHGVRSAIMNRSRRELDQITALSTSGEGVPLFELLFLDAEASLHSGRTAMTVVHAFQALEFFLEEFLQARLRRSGLDAGAVAQLLDQKWRTKDRLREVLDDATGHTLTENAALWDEFCTGYDQVRNRLIHEGKEIDQDKATLCLATCRAVVSWVSEL